MTFSGEIYIIKVLLPTLFHHFVWVFLFSNGVCMQVGKYSGAGGTVTLLISFSNSAYTIMVQAIGSVGGNNGLNFNWYNGERVYDLTNNGFSYGSYNGESGVRCFMAIGNC